MDLYHYSSIRPHAIVFQQDASPLSVTLLTAQPQISSRQTAEAQTALKKSVTVQFAENILERTGMIMFSLWH